MSNIIHPTAVIEPGTKLGNNVEIGPYTVLGKDVQIGDDTKIGAHCIFEYCTVGKGNLFTGAAYIGMPPQDFSYKGEHTRVVMGDGNIVRESVTVHRGTPSEGTTEVGSGCMLMANSHIAHDCHVGNNVVMVNCASAAGHVRIQDRATISGMVGMHQFTRIGKLCMLSGGSMISQDIIPYVMAAGRSARPVGLNLVGLRRSGMSQEMIKTIKGVYKTLFFEGLQLKEALDKLKSQPQPQEIQLMIEFIEGSKRGIARPRTGEFSIEA